jgi:elongation factor G
MSSSGFIDFDVDLVDRPLVTIANTVVGKAKFVKQTAGVGEYAHLEFELTRHDGPAAFRLAWQVPFVLPEIAKTGALKGVKLAVTEERPEGFQLALIRLTIVDGSYHEVDSTERAFATVAHLAVRDALTRARFVDI